MSDDADQTFVLRPRRVSPTELRWAERADGLEFDTLGRMRTAAERWAASLGAILALSGSIFILKGRDDVAQLSSACQLIVGLLLLGALLTGVAATYLAARAAQGIPRKIAWPTGSKLRAWERREALLAQSCLRASRVLALVTVGLVAGAVGVTWFGSARPPATATLLVLRSHGTPLCGTLLAETAHGVRVARPDAAPAVVPVSDLQAVIPVGSCPAGTEAR